MDKDKIEAAIHRLRGVAMSGAQPDNGDWEYSRRQLAARVEKETNLILELLKEAKS